VMTTEMARVQEAAAVSTKVSRLEPIRTEILLIADTRVE